MKKILICDDHSIIRRGLKFILANHFTEYEVAEVHSIKEAMTYIKLNKPNFAILDLQLSDGNMIEALPIIIELYPKLDVLIFSMSNEEIYAKRILQIGARGFLNKNADEEEVLRALKIFLSGKNYISQKLNDLMINDLRGSSGKVNENPFTNLSNREVEVTRHLLGGVHIRDISKYMDLHANTIVTYKHRLFEKLSIRTIVDLTNLARVYDFK
jgi:two-component system, NarL family, invasion response regulator UvrY